jgi:maleylacetate reductase
VIVRWGLEELDPLLAEVGIRKALLVTSRRFAELELSVGNRFTGVRRHAPVDVVEAAQGAAAEADGLLGVGGGSAIDTAKAVSARTGLQLVAIPTTYAGSEWTSYFGMRDEARRAKTGGGGAHTVAIVYEPCLTLGLPRDESVGTAMNALAHCAEALYAGPCEDASVGASLIARALPRVVADGRDVAARKALLEGAMHAGRALSERGLFLAHAMAQALGGHYGVSHGAANALCLAPALRFNAEVVPQALARLADAMQARDVLARIGELAGLGGFGRLRDLGVPEDELSDLAAETSERPGARANPRHIEAADVERLFRSVW